MSGICALPISPASPFATHFALPNCVLDGGVYIVLPRRPYGLICATILLCNLSRRAAPSSSFCSLRSQFYSLSCRRAKMNPYRIHLALQQDRERAAPSSSFCSLQSQFYSLSCRRAKMNPYRIHLALQQDRERDVHALASHFVDPFSCHFVQRI